MSATATKTMMSLEELQQTVEWNACTARQKFWLTSFIESNGDAFLATTLAYQSGSDDYARMLAYQIRQNDHVRAALNLYYGRTEQDEILDALRRKLLRNLRKGRKLTVAEKETVKTLFEARNWALPEQLRGELRVNGYTPKSKRDVPVGCRPILNGTKIVGYLTPDDERVDF